MKYEEPQLKVVMLPEVEVFTTLSGTPGGGDETVEPQPDDGTSSWLQSW